VDWGEGSGVMKKGGAGRGRGGGIGIWCTIVVV